MTEQNLELIAYELNIENNYDTSKIYSEILSIKHTLTSLREEKDSLMIELNEQRENAEDGEVLKELIEEYERQAELAEIRIHELESSPEPEQVLSAAEDQHIEELQEENEHLTERLAEAEEQLQEETQQLEQSIFSQHSQQNEEKSPVMSEQMAIEPSKGDVINYKITIKQQLREIQHLEAFRTRIVKALELEQNSDDDAIIQELKQLQMQESNEQIENIISTAEKMLQENNELKFTNQEYAEEIEREELEINDLNQKIEGEKLEKEENEVKNILVNNQNTCSGGYPNVSIEIFRDRVLDLIDDMRIDKKADLVLLKKLICEIEL